MKLKNEYTGIYLQSYPEVYAQNPARGKNFENLAIKFSSSLVFVILMWLSANSFFYLPFTPVPVTMQVFTVLFSALILGPYWAFASQVEYLMLGISGAPLFAGFKSGLVSLSGPTGGFLAGFALSCLAAGLIYNKNRQRLNNELNIFISCLAGLAVIYITGYFHLLGYFFAADMAINLPTQGSIFIHALRLGVLPFASLDFAKIAIIIFVLKDSGRGK